MEIAVVGIVGMVGQSLASRFGAQDFPVNPGIFAISLTKPLVGFLEVSIP